MHYPGTFARMPSKPRLTVFLLHDRYRRLEGALNLGLPPQYAQHGSIIEAERHILHLRDDVYRGHAGACAALVVSAVEGADADVRLAALHARREGLHRFLLVLDESAGSERSDLVERDVRELLFTLGVDGDDVPTVRTALPREDPSETRRLRAALDDLPAFLTPAPLLDTPPEFAVEAALLDVLAPLFVPATLFRRKSTSHVSTTTVHGGSYQGGAPHLAPDEPWPRCPGCRAPMAGLMQADTRDFLHTPPPAHGLFVVFVCSRGCDTHEVRHHATLTSERRQDPPAGRLRGTDFPRFFRSDTRCWQLPDPDIFVEAHPEAAARLSALTGDEDPSETYEHLVEVVGAGSLLQSGHFGGHHASLEVLTPCCTICGAPCSLVVQIDALSGYHSLWACREHPSSNFYRAHH